MSADFKGCKHLGELGNCEADKTLDYIAGFTGAPKDNIAAAVKINTKLIYLGHGVSEPTAETIELWNDYQKSVEEKAKEVGNKPKPILRQNYFCGRDNSCPWITQDE
jgi:hypothetical protein